MKNMKIEEYNSSLGTLIDVEDIVSFSEEHHPDAINIPYQKLLYNYNKYLDKSKKYFIMCKKNRMSKKVVSILSFYGYNVTHIIK